MAFPNYPSAQPGAGTLFQIGNAGCPESFNTVARIGNIKGPSSSWKTADTTSGSTVPSGGGTVFISKIPLVLDGGDITMDLFVKTDNGNDRLLLSYFRNGTFLDFQIVEPDTLLSKISGNGFFSKFDLDQPIEGVAKATVTFTTSGPLYWFE